MATPTVLAGEAEILDFSELTVFVGEVGEKFTLHKCFVKSSTFLEAAFREPSEVSQNRVIRLPETNPQIFAIFLQWLYTGEVVNRNLGLELSNLPKEQAKRLKIQLFYQDLFRLAILAHRLDDSALRDKIIDVTLAFRDENKLLPHPKFVAIVWSGLPATSPLRSLLVDLYAALTKVECLKKAKEWLPEDFFFSITIVLKQHVERGWKVQAPTYSNRCKHREYKKVGTASNTNERPLPPHLSPMPQNCIDDKASESKTPKANPTRDAVLQQFTAEGEKRERKEAEKIEEAWQEMFKHIKLGEGDNWLKLTLGEKPRKLDGGDN